VVVVGLVPTRGGVLDWLKTMPEPSEVRNAFLIQLTWADLLEQAEILNLVDRYEEEVRMQIKMKREERRRGEAVLARTPREAFLWVKIAENNIQLYEAELLWVDSLRQGLAPWGEGTV
jgi:PadR family transcriptional regulator, regulatory protein AphA